MDADASGQPESTRIVRLWLAAIEDLYDAGTMRLLRGRGLSQGWRCLEVGAGSGTIACLLAGSVAPTGDVVATDIDTRFLTGLRDPNLEVWRHDVTSDPFPEREFDLVHARLVLANLPDRDAVLRKLAAAVKSGGWLVLEENDNISIAPDPTMGSAVALHEKVRGAAGSMVAARTGRRDGGTYGRQLYGGLLGLGLSDVGAEGRAFMVRGGEPSTVSWRLLYGQIGPALLASGAVTGQELADYEALLKSPSFIMMGEIMMAAWGRRDLQ